MTKLTDEVKIEILRLHNDKWSSRAIAAELGLGKSTVNDFLSETYHKDWWEEHNKPIAAGNKYDHYRNLPRAKGKKFIVTSAQNNTYVHAQFLASLETMAEYEGAEIIVGTFSYNKTGFQNLGKGDGEWFDPKITKYIRDEPVKLADDLIWCGELNILPTAVRPLSGLQGYTKGCSGIVPHAKVQLESLPTHKNKDARFLYTTGAVTLRNYVEKKAGQKASFDHVYGALIVEVDEEGDWFVRQLSADSDTGHFYDLDKLYTPFGVETDQRVEAINYGDLHCEKGDPEAFLASFGYGNSMLNVLRPKYQMVHDVIDFTTRNHHNINDPYFRYQTYTHKVEDDFHVVGDVLESMQRDFSEIVVVESNHDLAFQRWLKEANYKNDSIDNALFFLEAQYWQLTAIKQGCAEEFSIFEHMLKDRHPALKDVRFLRIDESFLLCGEDGIEAGCHGHVGNGGARGSVQSFAKLEMRYNIGHGHGACIFNGVFMAGVLGKLDMGYNLGGSNWSHSNIVTYPNGKRTIVTIKNGRWRA